MGNASKCQMLTAAVTLSLFMLGSASMATAGIVIFPPEGVEIITMLEGDVKAKEWCDTWGDQAPINSEETGNQEKVKTDFDLWVDFGRFPDIDGVMVFGGAVYHIDGYGIRTKAGTEKNKGVFTMEGDNFSDNGFEGLARKEIVLNGTYKTNSKGVPIKISGKWFGVTHIHVPGEFEEGDEDLDRRNDIICTTQTGTFKGKGDGGVALFPLFED